jgi:hypothetical protein
MKFYTLFIFLLNYVTGDVIPPKPTGLMTGGLNNSWSGYIWIAWCLLLIITYICVTRRR